MVRLRAIIPFSGRMCLRFQFQDGAIKSIEISPSLTAFTAFQFQDGAIKRLEGLAGLFLMNKNFNSKMVRLRAL